jgi:hypothetical protein
MYFFNFCEPIKNSLSLFIGGIGGAIDSHDFVIVDIPVFIKQIDVIISAIGPWLLE